MRLIEFFREVRIYLGIGNLGFNIPYFFDLLDSGHTKSGCKQTFIFRLLQKPKMTSLNYPGNFLESDFCSPPPLGKRVQKCAKP